MMFTRIDSLKQAARRAYLAFQAEGGKVDCGAALLKEINPRAAQAARDFNETMAELQKLDPNCPKYTPL